MNKIKNGLISVSDFTYCHRRSICFLIIMAAAVFFRVWKIGSLPCGLNPDEASIGYDAWAIMNYGIDRNGVSLPVQLISWGSGQNALYAYLSMPFIAIMGLNTLSVRMVNLLFGILSVALVYFIVKQFLSRKYAFAAMAFVAVSPWHITICRWGLESNLFPLIFTAGVFLLARSFEKNIYLPFAAAVFALSLYSYGAAYVVVPVFVLAFSFYCYFKGGVSLKYIIISAVIFVLVALPIGLCFLTNRFGFGDISILGLTAPQVSGIGERWSELTEFSLKKAIRGFFEILFLQTDYTITNQITGYGYMYLISLPFTAVGAVKLVRERSHLCRLLFGWIACSFVLFFTYSEVNINRVNIIFIPIIIITGIGIGEILKNRKLAAVTVCCYAVMFISFCRYYFVEYNSVIAPFFYSSVEQAVPKAEQLCEEGETIYMTDSLNKSYIYALFYSKTPPKVFIDTADIPNKTAQFYDCRSFEGYVFDTSPIEKNVPGVYIMPNNEARDYIFSADQYFVYDLYTVLSIK